MKRYRNLLILMLLLVLVNAVSIHGAKTFVIGFSSPALNEFYIRFEDFAKIGARNLGVRLITLNAEDNGEKQIRDVEDLIARGVDGIIVAPVTDAIAKTILQKCETANIPVIVADRNPGIQPQDQFKKYLAFIGPDNEEAGYRIAKYLINNMSPGKDGVKSLVALEGKLGSSNSELRTKGLMRALAEHPEVRLLAKQSAGFDRDQGMKVMEDFLVAFDNIDAVWSANDAMALGAIAAIRNANRMNEMIVGGMDTDRDACESVARNQLKYTSGGHWLTGGFALVTLYDYLNGIPVQKEERFAEVKLMEITDPEDAKLFIKEFHDKTAAYDWLKMSRYHNPKAPAAYFEISLDMVKNK